MDNHEAFDEFPDLTRFLRYITDERLLFNAAVHGTVPEEWQRMLQRASVYARRAAQRSASPAAPTTTSSNRSGMRTGPGPSGCRATPTSTSSGWPAKKSNPMSIETHRRCDGRAPGSQQQKREGVR